MKSTSTWLIACLFAFITGIAVERNTCQHAKALAELKDCVLNNRQFQIGTNTVMQFRAFTEEEVLAEADTINRRRAAIEADMHKSRLDVSGFTLENGVMRFRH